MIIKLDINDRAALAIKNNQKRVEIRANDNKYDYSKLNSNDIIEFNSNKIYCRIWINLNLILCIF